jgi:hypothetical protein
LEIVLVGQGIRRSVRGERFGRRKLRELNVLGFANKTAVINENLILLNEELMSS